MTVSSVLQYALFAAVAFAMQRLPLRTVRGMARLVADAVFLLLPIRKSLTIRQLREAFPEHPDAAIRRMARGSYRNLFTTVFELMWTPRLTDDIVPRVLHVRNIEIMRAAVRRGHGVIFMSGHFGNWEWLSICGPPLLVDVKIKNCPLGAHAGSVLI